MTDFTTDDWRVSCFAQMAAPMDNSVGDVVDGDSSRSRSIRYAAASVPRCRGYSYAVPLKVRVWCTCLQIGILCAFVMHAVRAAGELRGAIRPRHVRAAATRSAACRVRVCVRVRACASACVCACACGNGTAAAAAMAAAVTAAVAAVTAMSIASGASDAAAVLRWPMHDVEQ